MKKLIIGIALATGISTAAMAEDKAGFPVFDLSFVTDTGRNMTQETTATEFGIVAKARGFTLGVLPSYSWNNKEISDIEFAAKYTYAVNETFDIVPYGEYHINENFNKRDTIAGIKTKYKF
jgi:opacity protein-like surface antigen